MGKLVRRQLCGVGLGEGGGLLLPIYVWAVTVFRSWSKTKKLPPLKYGGKLLQRGGLSSSRSQSHPYTPCRVGKGRKTENYRRVFECRQNRTHCAKRQLGFPPTEVALQDPPSPSRNHGRHFTARAFNYKQKQRPLCEMEKLGPQ